MTSKERVRLTLSKQKPDRVPAAYEAVYPVTKKLLQHYGFTSLKQLLEKFEIDIYATDAKYIGPELKTYVDEQGRNITTSYWGFHRTVHETDVGAYPVTVKFPLEGLDTIEKIQENYTFPKAEWFDYAPVAKFCENNPDKAIIIGHPGPFQMVTNLMSMDEFFILMYDDPEVASYILDQMVAFELEYYEQCLIAGKGKIDILRPHDDYGTQISMLFSTDMWDEFFKDNTKKLADLAHKYGAFYMQHSCGAVRPIISRLIDCGVDALEPVQKVCGLEVDSLAQEFEGKIVFHGGVDTQWLLPGSIPEEVAKETTHIINTLGKKGGYILMASQAFESDVPVENIEAVYSVSRIPQ
ncbi:hypothetical protein AN641_07660 [Candidatus Epulonipiscioides gigas]|nr:hypothetical protein AN641_07660 [Epulopiscium sp. SCG-C07WGA-EpuloA2]